VVGVAISGPPPTNNSAEGGAVETMAGASTIITGGASVGEDVETTLRSPSFFTGTDSMGATEAGANAT
jgi:hypothetical protein